MKKIHWLLFGALLIILFFIFKDSFTININSKNAPISQEIKSTPLENSNSSPDLRENTEGPVTVSVTPSFGNEFWNFTVGLNTHTVEISQDLTLISELIDDSGKVYKPLLWEGDPVGGHHRNGVLKFNALSPKPKSVELKIKEVGGIAKRSFKWSF